MSLDTSHSLSSSSDDINVEDEEGFVDKQLKKRVLEKRQAVDEVEEEAFVATQLGEIEYETALRVWHDRIRSWLQSIEPLLQTEELERAQEVYQEIHLGTVTLDPPADLANATGRPQHAGEASGTRVIGEVEPKAIPIHGLEEVIERQELYAQWEVTVQSDEPGTPPERTVRQSVSQPFPRWLLRDAVREADTWLQTAGIGFEISAGAPHGKT